MTDHCPGLKHSKKGKDKIIAATNIKKQQGYIESKTKSLHKL
jgi:hypothetical protein